MPKYDYRKREKGENMITFYQPQFPQTYNQTYQTIAGRYVNSFDEITLNEIPMNGQGAVFIKMDMSEVAIRRWENNGTISTRLYKVDMPINPSNNTTEEPKSENEPFNAFLGVFEERMKELNSKLDRLGKPKGKKEADDE